MRLGEILEQHGWIDSQTLTNALTIQSKNGSRLGDVLIGLRAIGLQKLHHALALQNKLDFVDLKEKPPERTLLGSSLAPEQFIKLGVMPWRRHDDGSITIAITQADDATKRWCVSQFGTATRFVMTSPLDIKHVIQTEFGNVLEKSSRLSLWQRFPMLSARTTLQLNQKQFLIGLGLILFALLALSPNTTLLFIIAACNFVFFITMLFKCWVFMASFKTEPAINWQSEFANLNEQTLPIYTVLIPMYHEKESLPGMFEAMKRLDYPASKLDIKLVLEADDEETYRAACDLKPAYHFDIIRVPAAEPRTKPKACNYALRFARGEYVTIFDADDRPEKTQLKKAIISFHKLSPQATCLQARLNYYNANDNLLTRFFSLEYTILFHFMLYGLSRLGIPIPLGGTSNHLSLSRLKELGEWDPYNVTEDADLGTRISARGGKTYMLDSYTMEEAPNQIIPWIKQRSRWIKGYMQTWLVHMRAPFILYRALGFRAFVGFQFFIGLSCVTFLAAPVVWLISLSYAFLFISLESGNAMKWLIYIAGFNLILNVITHWYLSCFAANHYKKYRLQIAIAALLYPVYMLLHSIASYRALWQLIVKPHFWDKTRHGLAHMGEPNIMENEMLRQASVSKQSR